MTTGDLICTICGQYGHGSGSHKAHVSEQTYCVKCGKPKYYIGDVPDGANLDDYVCTCYRAIEKPEQPTITPSMGYGWVCPICGAVNAPWKGTCDGMHVRIAITSGTNTQAGEG